jgi:hypothetical protein
VIALLLVGVALADPTAAATLADACPVCPPPPPLSWAEWAYAGRWDLATIALAFVAGAAGSPAGWAYSVLRLRAGSGPGWLPFASTVAAAIEEIRRPDRREVTQADVKRLEGMIRTTRRGLSEEDRALLRAIRDHLGAP